MKFTRYLALATATLCAASSAVFAAAEADLLAGYDQSYSDGAGGDDNAEVLIANAIASSNLINDRSGTGARVRIVGYHKSAAYNYQATSNGGFAGWMYNYDSRLSDVVDAGNALNADLITYVCESTADGAAAVAYQPGRYSSFDAGAFWSGVVAHELGGHNYGRSHSDGLLNPKSIMLHNYCGGGSAPPYVFTNQNIWFNNLRYIGDGDNCSMGGLINSGDNSLPTSDSAQAVADRYERIITAPDLSHVVHHWSFDQTAQSAPSGTSVGDQVDGGGDVQVIGSGATFTGNALRLPGGASSSSAAYLKLPSGIISSQTNVTVEIWATPLSVQNSARIVDFNNGTSNYLTLTSSNGTDINSQRFESMFNGSAVTLNSGLPTVLGLPHHYVITFTDNGQGGGRWLWYRDGDTVAYLDVNYTLASFPDVNNWLGRSAFSADAYANCDYQEVRISNVAMTRDQILANYQLGPNYNTTANVALTSSDVLGRTSFNATGNWDNASAPSSANNYQTFGFTLRTPATSVSSSFTGSSLTLSGGRMLYKGTSNSSVTVNNLILNNGTVDHGSSGTFPLYGNLSTTPKGGKIKASNGPINLNANISGSGSLTYVGNPVTLYGSNANFTGKTQIGDGNSGTLVITSEDKLGPAPASLVADQLTFNRGTLQTTTTLSIDDPTRGIFMDVDGGTFNVASGTTLTLASPITNANYSSNIIVGPLYKSGAGTLILDGTSGTYNGYLDLGGTDKYSDSGIVRIANDNVLSNAQSRIYIDSVGAGRSTLELDNNRTLQQSIFLSGRSNTVPAVHSISGSNTIGGATLYGGGSEYRFQCDTGTLTFASSTQSTTYVQPGYAGSPNLTLQGDGDFMCQSIIQDASGGTLNLTKLGAGTFYLVGSSSATGLMDVREGTLYVQSTISAGSIEIEKDAVLGGVGTISADTTIYGIHSPGVYAANQIFNGALHYTPSSRLNYDITTNGTSLRSSDRISGTSSTTIDPGAVIDVVLNRSVSNVSFDNSFWQQTQTWPVITATEINGIFTLGTVTTDSTGKSIDAQGYFYLQKNGGTLNLVYSLLPTVTPATPDGLTFPLVTTNNVGLFWNRASDAISYKVWRATSENGPYTLLASDVKGTGYYDTNVEPNTRYYYKISAVNALGESPVSTSANVRTQDEPDPTVAYWNFEEGTANTYVPYSPASAGQYDGSILDVSGHDNNLSTWSSSWAWYRTTVPSSYTPKTGEANTRSVQNANGYPSISAIGTSLTTWNPTAWTIEATIKPDNATSGGYQTVVGRDSYGAYSANAALAALYFQITPTASLRILFTDSSGNLWQLSSADGVITAGQWQAIVVTSNGKTLSLYRKNITAGDTSYTLLGTLDISSSVNPALSVGAGAGSGWEAGVITVGRGLYDSGHTDRYYGYIDDVRLSEAALSPDAFLYSLPHAPTGLTATTSTASTVDLSWNAVPGATGYKVYRSTTSGGPYTTLVSNISQTTYQDGSVSAGTTYYYTVSSMNGAGEGTKASEVSIATSTPATVWRQEYFGNNWNNDSIAGDAADPDADGISNLLERAFGGNPTSPENYLLPAIDDSADLLSITYRKSVAATDLTYSVQETDDLASGNWIPATGSEIILSDDGTVQTIRFTRPANTNTKLFLRIEVVAP